MILIVESGATKTDWCALAPDGSSRRLQTPGMNLSTIDAEANAAVLADAVDAFSDVDEVHFYAAGLLEFPTELDRVFQAKFPGVRCEYASDLLAAARAACGHGPGLAAILGTGSNTCHYDGERIVRNIHGGGFISNDARSRQANLMIQYFRNHGYACASVNYRLAQEAPFPAAIVSNNNIIIRLIRNAVRLDLRSLPAGHRPGGVR